MVSFFITAARMLSAFFRGIRDKEFQVLLVITLATLASGTIFYHTTEGWRILDALYFSVTTLTTVGYGDLSPQTDMGKIFTILYLFAGIGIIFGFVHKVAFHIKSRKSNDDGQADT